MKFLQATRPEFIPASPSRWFSSVARKFIEAELALKKDRLHVEKKDIEILANLPLGAGAILTPNHADEADPRLCFWLSGQARRSFITMANREAFDELNGLGGWALQRLGCFSVKRGAKDLQAKEYAIEVVRKARDVLVVFPEGEIFYQNEKLQHFHPGAIDICLRAIVDNRKTIPTFTAFVVPMVIKYHYSRPIEYELDKRISKMEAELSIQTTESSLQKRLLAVAAKIIERKHIAHELETLHEPGSLTEVSSSNETTEELQHFAEPADPECYQQDLSMKIKLTQNAIFQKVEHRHNQASSARLPIISRSWKLAAEIRQKAAQELKDSINKENLVRDLKDLQEVEHLSAWSPRYLRAATSNDRLAESVMKLERELFKIKRPKPIPGRDIYVRIAKPIELGQFACDYGKDARAATSQVTQLLQSQIQSMLDELQQKTSGKNPITAGAHPFARILP